MGAPLAVIGAGYVGLVTVVGLAELGHEVYCIEIDARKVDRLRRAEVPFYEPGLAEGLAKHRGRIHFDTAYRAAANACSLFLVAVGTPRSRGAGQADLSAVNSVVDQVPLSEGQALVMKSTVPPGTGASCRLRLDRRGLQDVPYVACPEFLRESTGLTDFAHPDRVVIGDQGTWAGDAVEELYLQIATPQQIVRMDVTSAETMKLAANAFLATKISFINEVANICDAVGADVGSVAAAIGMDPRVGSAFLRPGIGFGGSCFGKDLASLAHEANRLGHPSQILDAAQHANERQWRRVIDKLEDHLGQLRGKRIALLGLAFKPGTSNTSDASSLPVLDALVTAGVAVSAYDPKVRGAGIRQLDAETLDTVDFAESALDCVAGADATVLITEWPDFLNLDWGQVRERMRGALLIDGRNALDPAQITAQGLVYDGIGQRGRSSGERGDDRTGHSATASHSPPATDALRPDPRPA